MRPLVALLALSFVPALAGERICKYPSEAVTSDASASKKDPEPGPIKGKVEDGIDGIEQKTRWSEKSVEARTEKEVPATRERVRTDFSEQEVELPDRF